jgi:hypothetical protein
VLLMAGKALPEGAVDAPEMQTYLPGTAYAGLAAWLLGAGLNPGRGPRHCLGPFAAISVEGSGHPRDEVRPTVQKDITG